MPWNDQSGGNNNGGGRGPWGQGPSGGNGGGGQGGGGPDLEDLLRRGQERFRRATRRNGGGGDGGGGGFGGLGAGGAFIVVLLLLGAWLFTGVFQVNPGEVGVVTRFGAYDREVTPGLHLHLPYPIEARYVTNVQEVRRVNIGFAEEGERNRSRPSDALMLTGDENIIRIDFTVLWNINSARDYLFNIRDQEGAVRAAAESALREVAGQNELQTLLTLDRAAVAERVETLLQGMLDSYGAGVNIVSVNLQNVLPPDDVQDAFDEVQSAEQNEVRAQNEANQYAAQITEEAGGRVEAIIQSAEGYREQTIAEAEGEAARFISIYDEYVQAPGVTRQRMYLETMERVFGDMDKIILDDDGNGGVVPYLPLNEIQRSGSRSDSN